MVLCICIADSSHLVILIMLTEKRNNLALAKLVPVPFLANNREDIETKNQIVFFFFLGISQMKDFHSISPLFRNGI